MDAKPGRGWREQRMSEPKWGWCSLDVNAAQGPFETRAEAVADAEDAHGLGSEDAPVDIDVGHCCYPDPAHCVDTDLDSMLNRMDEVAAGSRVDRELFGVCGDREAADLEYRRLLQEFVRKWIRSDAWVLGDEVG